MDFVIIFTISMPQILLQIQTPQIVQIIQVYKAMDNYSFLQ